MKIEGVTRVEDLINNLPQAFADFGGNLSNGATGTATVNLRGLGPQRTLVLINGRRLMPGDPTQNGAGLARPQPDSGRADRACRSADRRRLRRVRRGRRRRRRQLHHERRLRGRPARCAVQLLPARERQRHRRSSCGRATSSCPTAASRTATTQGHHVHRRHEHADGRGNATVYVGYRRARARFASPSATSARARSRRPSDPTQSVGCGGSGTTGASRVHPRTGNPVNGRATGDFTSTPDGSLRAFGQRPTSSISRRDNYYQRPDERYTAGLFAHYDVSDKASVYTEFMFMDDARARRSRRAARSSAAVPAQPPFFGNYAINCDNPFLSAARCTQFCGGDRDRATC